MDTKNELRSAEAALPKWRKKFHTLGELPDAPIVEFIQGFLSEGITGIGSQSGVGKTLIALSMAKALVLARPLFGRFSVLQAENVLYLCPEMIGKAVRMRGAKFGIPFNFGEGKDGKTFLVQTMEDGITPLTDPDLKTLIGELHPVVFLDTAIRFTSRRDENSASENAEGLAKALFLLLKHGAKAVVFLHHAPKGNKEDSMTLENMFRGTGDMGAMVDTAWGVRWDDGRNNQAKYGNEEHKEQSQELTRLFVKNLKPRDIRPVPPFRIQGRPYIDTKGDFVVLEGIVDPATKPTDSKAALLLAAILDNPKASDAELSKASGYHRNWVKKAAASIGYTRSEDGSWQAVVPDPLFPTCADGYNPDPNLTAMHSDPDSVHPY
jgi:hypothetical protein